MISENESETSHQKQVTLICPTNAMLDVRC